MKDITAEELKVKIDNKVDFFFLDVRETFEYDEYNMNALNIPLGILPLKLDELADYREQEIVVHCRSGARSANAKQLMLKAGFQNVRNLLGGAMDWQGKYGNAKKEY